MGNPGRLPDALAARVDTSRFATPSPAAEALIAAWEARWDGQLVTYRAKHVSAPHPPGDWQLCQHACAAALDPAAAQALAALERQLPDLILVAYARPWRFR